MLIDANVLCIGTVNLNVRSLERDDELFVYFESDRLTEEYAEISRADFTKSLELDYARFKKTNAWLAGFRINSVLVFTFILTAASQRRAILPVLFCCRFMQGIDWRMANYTK